MAHRGAAAEALAAAYLTRRGLTVVARNWRCRYGELDLIARDGRTLVFVEVRQRTRGDFGGAAASITATKRARLIAAARHYLAGLGRTPACRFDVLVFEGADAEPEWLRSAFDAD